MREPAYSARLLAFLWLCLCGSAWADTADETSKPDEASDSADAAKSSGAAVLPSASEKQVDPKETGRKTNKKKHAH